MLAKGQQKHDKDNRGNPSVIARFPSFGLDCSKFRFEHKIFVDLSALFKSSSES